MRTNDSTATADQGQSVGCRSCLISIGVMLSFWFLLWGYSVYDRNRKLTWLIPDGVQILKTLDVEPGIAADGHRLRVFRASPEVITKWKRTVSDYTQIAWRDCPMDRQITETHPISPELFFQPAGQYNLSYYDDGVLSEVFYVSPDGECWWYEHW